MPLAGATLEIIGEGQIAVGGLLVHEQRQRFATARDAAVKLRIGAKKIPRVQICPAEIEVADPRIKKTVGVAQRFDRLRGVVVLRECITFNYFRVGSKLGRRLRSQFGRQQSGPGQHAGFDKQSCGQKSNLRSFAVH